MNWNLEIVDLSNNLQSNCPICLRARNYKTKLGHTRGINKPCRSCANSISAGGKGFSELCKCGNAKYKFSSSYCSECLAKNCKQYHLNHYRYARYGVNKEWFDKEIINGCAICKTSLLDKKAHIDHCHKTNKVRGVLCELCNKGLGQFKDNIASLENAVKYLKESK